MAQSSRSPVIIGLIRELRNLLPRECARGIMWQFNEEHLEKVKPGIRLFNQKKYWECHEELEHHWLEDRGDNVRLVYWAVIQVAASLYHYHGGNLTGARGMLSKAKDKFNRAEKGHVESELLEKELSWTSFKSLARQVPDDPQLKDFDKLDEFIFPDKGQKP